MQTMTTPDCPYCGEGAQPFVSAADYNRHTTEEMFHYFQCGSCRLVFMHPVPAEMGVYYTGGYQKIPSSLEELEQIALTQRYRLEPILRYKTGGTLLEIGPWMGIFSCNAKSAGFKVSAIELDQSCVAFLNDTLGIRACQSANPAETLQTMDESFDVIVLWHCLEHLPDPWLVVEAAAKRLAPDGILLIAIPNIESNEFRIFKGRWCHLDAPRHLFFYPPAALIELCRKSGLDKLELTTTDALSSELSRYTWLKWATEKIPVRYVRGAVRRVALYVSHRKEIKEESGSGITAVFRKAR